MPCADLYEMYLANGWQARENCPYLKPLDARTFGRVIDFIGPNVTKTKRLLSAVCDSCPPDRSFSSWSLFAHGCDVTSMNFVGSLMALAHSLTHSILINLFIKVKLNTFPPTSPAKYCFCPKHFLAYVWLVCQGTREG